MSERDLLKVDVAPFRDYVIAAGVVEVEVSIVPPETGNGNHNDATAGRQGPVS